MRQKTRLALPCAVVQQRLLAYLPMDGLCTASAAATDAANTIMLRAGVGPVSKQVQVQRHPAYLRGQTTVVPFRWVATGTLGELFPTLDANLELDPAENGECWLTLLGCYRPPLGAVGQRFDEIVLGRVAAATARSFLSNLSRVLLVAHETVVAEPAPLVFADPSDA